MTDAAHADKADSDTAPAKTLEGRRPALAPGPVGGQELASVSGTGIPLRRPASMLGLQRLAGNRSVAQMLQRAPVVQRADKPTTLTEALRTGESDQLQPFRPFTGITPHQLLSLVNLIVTEAWVAPWEETMLEEAWTARGSADLTEADWTLWQSCAKRGANIRNVPWLRELRASFADKVYETAKDNLYRSGQTLEKEKTKLGIGAEKPTADQDAAIKRQQELARKVKRANEALNKLTLIDVGYADPPAQSTSSDSSRYGGGSKPGGLDDAAARTRFAFKIDQQPPFAPVEGDGMTTWSTVAAVYRGLTERVSNILNANPALYALVELDAARSTQSTALNVITPDGQAPGEARQQLGQAIEKVIDNIAKTRDDVVSRDLSFGAMLPVHERLYSADPVWRKPFQKRVALEAVADDNAAAANGALLVTLAVAAAVEIGTAGLASPVLPMLITATSSAAVAADSWSRWMQLDRASKATSSDQNALVSKETADDAATEALTNTAFALIDVFFALAKTAVSMARVADLQAQLAERQALATLATKSAEEQKTLVTSVVERDGAQAALTKTGRSAPDLIAIVGAESPAGKSLASISGAGALTEADVVRGLPLLATKTAEEAKALVSTGIETLGPAQTLARGGGMAGIEAATHADATVLGRLTKWRDSLVGRVEPMLDAAETTEQARGFLADLAGIPIDQIETALGIGLVLATSLDVDVKSSVDGAYGGATLDLEAAVAHYAAEHGEPSVTYDDEGRPLPQAPVQRQVIVPAAPVPLTDRQLNMLSGAEFEDLMRQLIGSGHFAPEGLPTMSVMEIKVTGGDNGIDGIGLRRRGQYVDTYKFEFKQIQPGGVPELPFRPTMSGVQGGMNWTDENINKLFVSDNPVAMETLDELTRRLRRYFGPRYSESLLLDAFRFEIRRAPLIVVTRLHADLSTLLPQIRGLARSLGKGKVKLLLVRGR